jgi:Rap1a immunity proteins
VIAALGFVMLGASPLPAAEDVHSTRFWISHCKKADMACIGYLQAMLDINSFDQQNGVPVKWCAPHEIILDDLRKKILRGLRAKPVAPEVPFVTAATNTLITAYPCLEGTVK